MIVLPSDPSSTEMFADFATPLAATVVSVKRAPAAAEVDFVDKVDRGPNSLLVSVTSGASAVSPVAVTLDGIDAEVAELTLRTPTLDDVFLELTGDRIEVHDS